MNSRSLSKPCRCRHFEKITSVRMNLIERGWFAHSVNLYHDQEGSLFAGKRKIKISGSNCWKNELNILKSVDNHQNIIRYFTTCSYGGDNSTTIIMELCDGNLEEYILDLVISPLTQLRSTKQSSVKAQSYFKSKSLDLLYQVTKGIQFLHKNNIVHCCVEPSNVLLKRTFQNNTIAKLGGFGHSINLCSFNVSCFPTSEIEISSPYVASECFSRGEWSRSSDIYAFGVLIYHTLSGGKYPIKLNSFFFEIKNNQENVKKSHNFTELMKDTNTELETTEAKITTVDMVKRMICHDPKKRLTIDDVAHHPTFYGDQKKLDFLLKIHETVKNSELTFRCKTLNVYDKGLFNRSAVGSERFQINSERLFKNFTYFMEIQKKPKNWRYISFDNVESLLKALRDKVTHACDGPNGVPSKFEDDFEVTGDSYSPKKFLEIFLSETPQLLVHLYELFRNSDAAADFYAKRTLPS